MGGSAGTNVNFEIKESSAGNNPLASQVSLFARSADSSNYAQINIGVARPGGSSAQIFMHDHPSTTPAQEIYFRVGSIRDLQIAGSDGWTDLHTLKVGSYDSDSYKVHLENSSTPWTVVRMGVSSGEFFYRDLAGALEFRTAHAARMLVENSSYVTILSGFNFSTSGPTDERGTDHRITVGRENQYGIVVRQQYNTGVYAGGNIWDFYAVPGGGGTYGSFTGSHDCVVKAGEAPLPGMIVAVTGVSYTTTTNYTTDPSDESITDALVEVEVATQARAKAVFGVYVMDQPDDLESHAIWGGLPSGADFAVAAAVGDGQVLVSDQGGNIEAGDYITVGAVPGIGVKQADDLLRNSTVAKSTENVDWSTEPVAFSFNGQPVKVKLVTCTYHCG
jgi:hypothetical protein